MADRAKLFDKIRALLAKTTERGCTEAEALAALDKARAMMDAYEITEADLQLTRDEAAVLHRTEAGNDPHHIKRGLYMAVARFCDCEGWHSKVGRNINQIVFCGMLSDVQFAAWLTDSLALFVQEELAKYLKGNLAPRGERRFVINGFVVGCTARISARLDALAQKSEATAKADASGSRSLVSAMATAKADALGAAKAKVGIRLRRGRASRRRLDGDGYRAGQAAGERASFGRPTSIMSFGVPLGAKSPYQAE